jgi:hypothetical protein
MTFGPVHDLTMENNWFGPPVTGLADPGRDTANDNQQEIQFDPRSSACWKNILVRYNSFFNGPAPAFDGGTCYQNVRYVGNIIGSQGQCVNASGLTWSFNAWLGGGCGSTDISISSLPYANKTIGSEDFHLTGGIAQDLISSTASDFLLMTDIDGQTRPRGPARDAGADER